MGKFFNIMSWIWVMFCEFSPVNGSALERFAWVTVSNLQLLSTIMTKNWGGGGDLNNVLLQAFSNFSITRPHPICRRCSYQLAKAGLLEDQKTN